MFVRFVSVVLLSVARINIINSEFWLLSITIGLVR